MGVGILCAGSNFCSGNITWGRLPGGRSSGKVSTIITVVKSSSRIPVISIIGSTQPNSIGDCLNFNIVDVFSYRPVVIENIDDVPSCPPIGGFIKSNIELF